MIKKIFFVIYGIFLFVLIYFLSINKYEWMIDEGDCLSMRCLPHQDGMAVLSFLAIIPIFLLFLFKKSINLTTRLSLFIVLFIYWFWRFYYQYI